METQESLDDWFVKEILPLEPMIMDFLRRHWRSQTDIDDLRQQAYVRVYDAAARERPLLPKALLIKVIRELLVERQRKDTVVPIGALTDLDELALAGGDASPEGILAARQDVARLQMAFDGLSEQCRDVVILRKVHHLSQWEVARRMGIHESAVEQHLAKAFRVLARCFDSRRGAAAPQVKRLDYQGKRPYLSIK